MKSVLNLLKIADAYERKARLYPAIVTILPAVVLILSFKTPEESWVSKLFEAGGVGAVLVVAMAQFASAAGNRFSGKFWPPKGGLPTLRWLRPADTTCSTVQKQQWHDAIKRITGLDIPKSVTAAPAEEDAIIEDATRQVRYKLRGKAGAKMMDLHNQEYGFARNLAGLRWIMVCLAVIGAGGSAIAWELGRGSAWGSLIDGLLLIFAISMSAWLPPYVERAGIRYSESFFSALLAMAEKNTKEAVK